MASPKFVSSINYPLPPEAGTGPIPEQAWERFAFRGSHREWLDAGTDDLRVGDVVLIRQMVPAVAGRGSHGQRIVQSMPGYRDRDLVVREPWIAVCAVDRVYRKSTTKVDGPITTMVNFAVIWDNAQGGGSRPAKAFAQTTIVAENAEPIGRRQLEVRRLRGSGPTRAERAMVTAEEHSIEIRKARLVKLMSSVSSLDRILGGNRFVEKVEDRIPPTAEELASWRDGCVEAPSWVFNALERQQREDDELAYRYVSDDVDEHEEALEAAPAPDPVVAVVELPAAPEPVNVAPAEPVPAPTAKRSPFTLGWLDEDGLDLHAHGNLNVLRFDPSRYKDIDEDSYLAAVDEDDDMDDAA